jgi:ubiquinone/menaquinone biosynthesis C-methylase UbiE
MLTDPMSKQMAHGDQVRRLFDAKAPTWSAKYADDGRLAARLDHLVRAARSHVPVASRVLDLGCGTGELARAMASIGMVVTACDISSQMLRFAAETDQDSSINWVQLDPGWRTLPFGEAYFDAVVAASVLEYVDDPCAVLGECARVIRPGGEILCTVPNTRHPMRWLERAAWAVTPPPLVEAMAALQPRISAYMVYLQLSKQRHSVAWWHMAGAQAGLYPVPGWIDAIEDLPLRLLVFRRSEESGESQCLQS